MRRFIVSPRASIALSLVLLAAVLGVGWLLDAALFLRLWGVARPAFAANPNDPSVHVDDLNDLNAYPPNRLAKFLAYPSSRVRHVVCLALASRRAAGDPETWAGVLPALMASYRAVEGRERRHVANALLSLPQVLPADAESVFDFAEDQLLQNEHSWSLGAALLDKTARCRPELSPRVLQTFERSMDHRDRSVREESIRLLASIAPKSSEAATAARRMAREAKFGGHAALPSPPLYAVLQNQPSLIDELLSGSSHDRAVALSAATRILRDVGGRDDGGTPIADWLPAERLDRMTSVAAAMLGNVRDDPREEYERVATSLLGLTPGNEGILFDHARATTGRRRGSSFDWAVSSARKRSSKDAERFVETHLAEVLGWLKSDDERLQQAVLNALFPDQADRDWLKPHRTGHDAPIVLAVRDLFDRHPGRHDYIFHRVVADYGPELDPRDVDRLVAYFERKFEKVANEFKKDVAFTGGSLTSLERRLLDRLLKHQTRPNVRRVVERRRSLQSDGALRNAFPN